MSHMRLEKSTIYSCLNANKLLAQNRGSKRLHSYQYLSEL